MNQLSMTCTLLLAGGIAFTFIGCDRSSEPAPSPPPPSATSPAPGAAKPAGPAAEPSAKPEPAPADAPAKPAPSATAEKPAPAPGGTAAAGTFAHEGIAFDVPAGWTSEPVGPGAMGVAASYRLPKAEGDEEGASVRISHYPNMKGMDEMNINRWVGQMKKPDGSSCTREDAAITTEDMGSIRLTIVDLTGALAGMMGSGPTKANQRMIAVIVDHANGPHFVRVAGDVATVAKSHDAILSFVHGVRAK